MEDQTESSTLPVPLERNPTVANANISQLKSPTLLALPPPDFRTGRCFLSASLTDPAGEQEKICWTEAGFPKEFLFDDFDDSKGYYNTLGCNKASSDKEIVDAFKRVSNEFKKLARTNHPDKTCDADKLAAYRTAYEKWEKQKEALEVLGTLNKGGTAYPDCVNYDQEGEGLCKLFREEFEKSHPGESLEQRAEVITHEKARAEIFVSGRATRKVIAELQDGSLESVAHFWTIRGHQDNASRVHLALAILEDHKYSVIARYIRNNLYNSKKKVSNLQ